MEEEKKELKDEKVKDVAGGGTGSGYCPYTTDRTCRLSIGFDNENEDCKYCGWRAW